MRFWTPEEDQLLRELRAQSSCPAEHAKHLGRSAIACAQRWQRLNGKVDVYVPVVKKRATRKLTEADIERIRRLLKTYTVRDTAMLVGCSAASIGSLRRRGWQSAKGQAERKRPSDFALLEPTMTIKQLSAHYATGQAAIYRWVDEIGGRNFKRPHSGRIPAPVPRDFAQIYPTLRTFELCERYGVTKTVIVRWRDECGLPRKWHETRTRRFQARKAAPKLGWADQMFARAA